MGEDVVFPLAKKLVGAKQGFLDAFGVVLYFFFGFQFLLFSVYQFGVVDFLKLVEEVIVVVFPTLQIVFEVLQLVTRLFERMVCKGVFLSDGGVSCYGVENFQLEFPVVQE